MIPFDGQSIILRCCLHCFPHIKLLIGIGCVLYLIKFILFSFADFLMLISPLIDDCSVSLRWVDFLFFHHMRSILSTSCFSQSCKSSQGHSCTISVMDEIIQLPNPILSGTVARSGNLSWSDISISCSYLLLIVRQQFSKYHSISPIHFQLSMSWTIEHSTRVELILTMVSYFLRYFTILSPD